MSETKENIYTRLLKVQAEVGAVSKDSTNPFLNSKYFDVNKLIEHVNPILTKYGLVLLQPIHDGIIQSTLIEAETGEMISSELQLPTYSDPQKLGSCITYYRRYTLASLLGLQADDTDGHEIKAKTPVKASKPKIKPEKWDAYFDKVKGAKDVESAKKHIKDKYSLTPEQEKDLTTI